jgi:para-aminobenzoate synthetase
VQANVHNSALPDAWFVFADRVVIFDHLSHSVYLVAIVGANEREAEHSHAWFETVVMKLRAVNVSPILERPFPPSQQPITPQPPLQFELVRNREDYQRDIAKCLELIAAGESYEICLTNRLRADLPPSVDVLELYCILRLLNPAPYSAFLRLDTKTAICCSSPERFLHVSSDGVVESKPIKGTRPRGSSLEEDEALAEDLRTSVKDRSENLMIVDLVRNDLGRTCAVGSVTVPKLMEVETYASVHQLVSTVRGQLAGGISATVDCVRQAYPMGSMTGAPKVRTLSLIDQLETSARGVYSGTIGYLSLCGAADLNVVIRTAVVADGRVEIGVGGAIVALSQPDEEFFETLVKGRAIMQAVALASTGSSEYVVRGSLGHSENCEGQDIVDEEHTR